MGFDHDELYPNQPLSDVACEVRFPGEMRVECDRGVFWDQIRSDYPQILVPLAKEGQPPALQHYRFRNEDNNRTVSVALNSLVYSEKRYRGHKLFIGEFVRLVRLFRATYPKINKPNRMGWRYINLMPFSREDGSLPLGRLLKFNAELPLNLFERTKTLDFQWTGSHKEAQITLRLAAVQRKDLPGQEAVLLDIDYALEAPNLSWDDIPDNVAAARATGREIFEQMITDDYRKYLRGEKL